MNAKNISVIIPVKNRLKFTKEALSSVCAQNISKNIKVKILVVNDHSRSQVFKSLSKNFPQANVLKNKGKSGPGTARNVGLRSAKGDYIAFLDNDDQWKSGFLAESIEALEKSRLPAVVCLTWPSFYGKFPFKRKFKLIFLNLIKSFFITYFYFFNNKSLPPGAFYLCQISHMVFKKKSLKRVRFNEENIVAEDWGFIINAARAKNIAILYKPLVKFRYEIKSSTNKAAVKNLKKEIYYSFLKKIPKMYNSGVMNWLFRVYVDYFLVK